MYRKVCIADSITGMLKSTAWIAGPVLALALAGCSTTSGNHPIGTPAASSTSPTTVQQAITAAHSAQPTSAPQAEWVAWARQNATADMSKVTDGDIITSGEFACSVIAGKVSGSVDPKTAAELRITLCP